MGKIITQNPCALCTACSSLQIANTSTTNYEHNKTIGNLKCVTLESVSFRFSFLIYLCKNKSYTILLPQHNLSVALNILEYSALRTRHTKLCQILSVRFDIRMKIYTGGENKSITKQLLGTEFNVWQT